MSMKVFFFVCFRINEATQITDDWSSIVSTPDGTAPNHHCPAQLLDKEQTGGKAGLTAKEKDGDRNSFWEPQAVMRAWFGRQQQCLGIFLSQRLRQKTQYLYFSCTPPTQQSG